MKIVITGRNFDEKAKQVLKGNEIVDYSYLNLGPGADPNQMIECIQDAQAVICGPEPINAKIMDACSHLQVISRRGIGYDNIDVSACQKRNIAVLRTTGLVEAAVAEHALAFLLYFARNINQENKEMHQGLWHRQRSMGAKNRRLGLIGFGDIGKEIAKRYYPFGMDIVYYCRHPHKEWDNMYHVQYADLDTLLSSSDYISINVPLTNQTKGMIDKEELAKMKPESVLINIARASIVDTQALKAALMSHQIRGAAIDVFDHEPCTDSPFIDCDNAILTPHVAPFTTENFQAMNQQSAQNIVDWQQNKLNRKYQVV